MIYNRYFRIVYTMVNALGRWCFLFSIILGDPGAAGRDLTFDHEFT